MNSVLEKLQKKDSRDDVRRFSNGADKISIATDNLPLHLDKGITPLNACNGTEQITIQDFCVLAQNIDHLLADSSALTFFIQFLECYDKLNLVKFWIHVEGFKASLGEERVGCSQDAETSRELSPLVVISFSRNNYNNYEWCQVAA
ncbi:hypothetical protein GCK32_018820 [Trichostrongylus colubriformis]|uniref:RGS domain-containing protein n=1 Tax=Trichostrongylus colubriformis TaxID=6319 RepID=A0AAN8EVY9_TRICO